MLSDVFLIMLVFNHIIIKQKFDKFLKIKYLQNINEM